MVVSDIRIISDKDSLPHGYCFIAEHLEPSEHTHTFILIQQNASYSFTSDLPCDCLSRGHSFQEKTCVHTHRPSGQCGNSCVGYQADSQKQNDVAALHICGVHSDTWTFVLGLFYRSIFLNFYEYYVAYNLSLHALFLQRHPRLCAVVQKRLLF